MLKNLLQNGTVFDYSGSDQSYADDLLNADIGETIQVTDGVDLEPSLDDTFEDED